jgi:hypothetical protein
LQQDLNVSLGGGGLSVGATLGGVSLVDPLPAQVALMDSESDPAAAPEPCSGVLLTGGGALLWALAKLRRSKLSRGAEGALERDSHKLAAGSHASLLK